MNFTDVPSPWIMEFRGIIQRVKRIYFCGLLCMVQCENIQDIFIILPWVPEVFFSGVTRWTAWQGTKNSGTRVLILFSILKGYHLFSFYLNLDLICWHSLLTRPCEVIMCQLTLLSKMKIQDCETCK